VLELLFGAAVRDIVINGPAGHEEAPYL